MVSAGDDEQALFGCAGFVIFVCHVDRHKFVVRSVYKQHRNVIFAQGFYTVYSSDLNWILRLHSSPVAAPYSAQGRCRFCSATCRQIALGEVKPQSAIITLFTKFFVKEQRIAARIFLPAAILQFAVTYIYWLKSLLVIIQIGIKLSTVFNEFI